MSTLVHLSEEYLLNSLWQAPLLLGVAWLMARVLRRLGPAAEHRVWVAALLAETVVPACAAPGLTRMLRLLVSAKGAVKGSVTVTLGTTTPTGAGVATTALRCCLVLYGCVTMLLVLRFVWQYLQVRLLARRAAPLTLTSEDTSLFEECRAQFRLGKVGLADAALLQTPVTFGLVEPMLLLPRGFVEQVSRMQLRTTLCHELAHVARRDAAKHVLYQLISLPVAYHPAMWFTLSHIAETRERVCDRMAAEATGDARHYAHTLLELASLLTAKRPAQSHAIGLFDANQLERRILMLNRREIAPARLLRMGVIAGSAVLAVLTCASAVALHTSVEDGAGTSGWVGSPQERVASGVMANQVITKQPPKYPEAAKKARIQGAVVLAATIGKDGTVEHLTVQSGPEELRASSLEAVRAWRYTPYLLNGVPTEVETTITINFSIGDAPPPADAAALSPATVGLVAPKLLSDIIAKYPEAARKEKISGEVVVGLTVLPNGSVTDVAALSGPAMFRDAATGAVKQYVFEPATMHGQPVPISMQVSVKFQAF